MDATSTAITAASQIGQLREDENEKGGNAEEDRRNRVDLRGEALADRGIDLDRHGAVSSQGSWPPPPARRAGPACPCRRSARHREWRGRHARSSWHARRARY